MNYGHGSQTMLDANSGWLALPPIGVNEGLKMYRKHLKMQQNKHCHMEVKS